ncbi:phosphoglycerate mutase family protein [Westerdykella ornata]|uniref:Phosphoglycerate mutase family protein n=1 Tax=Westerdykella ornata TaxID=318751 RepID=A0A6A6JA65_WESOR|nr:phosphoglycerate mutase family protein [Westerdykella ornata]KAF2273490.1 phosphoglycerate mutase family protein [Westerdykella ornata]
MLETIYVTRHAFRSNFTVDPKTGVYTANPLPPTGIPTDVPLTAYGVQQSEQLADYLCQIDPPVDRIYSSPMYRCIQTLQPTAERLFAQGKAGGKIRVDHGLGEFYGKAFFEHPTPPDLKVLQPFFDSLDHEYEGQYKPHAKGEMILELHERVKNAISHIIETLDKDPEGPKTLLLCTHAATMIALGRVLTGKMPENLDEDDFQCYTASLSTFKRKSEATVGNWECVGNAETHFLSAGAERGWKFNGEESFIIDFDTPEPQPAPVQGLEASRLQWLDSNTQVCKTTLAWCGSPSIDRDTPSH